jgi:HEAT repeat protein
VAALLVARRLHQGYLRALERGLELRADQLPVVQGEGTATLLQTVGGFEITRIRSARVEGRIAQPEATVAAKHALDSNPERVRLRDLESTDPVIVGGALADGPLTPGMVERAIRLLAWDEVAPSARKALQGVARSETVRLVARLLDPGEDFSVRRRLVPVLAECPTPEAFEGLLQALADRRFEVRYRAGRALGHLRNADPRLTVDPERVLAVVLNEVAVERGVWESRQVLDEAEEPWAPEEAELLRVRASRSMEHVFTLLALILPREHLILAYRGLHTEDPRIHGTALEYLESVLPERVRKGLWPYLEPGESRPAKPPPSAQEALDNLLASRESIMLALVERKRI